MHGLDIQFPPGGQYCVDGNWGEVNPFVVIDCPSSSHVRSK